MDISVGFNIKTETLTVPTSETIDKSLRIKSTNIRCSERSFTSAIIDVIIPKSADLLAPRVTVPLIGAVDNIPLLHLSNVSGEEETIARPKSTASM